MLIIAAALILALPFIFALHLRLAAKRLRKAEHTWGSLEQYARVLLEDRHLNPEAGDVVEFVVQNVGDGAFTRTFLFTLLFGGKGQMTVGNSFTAKALRELKGEQEQQFLRLLVAALLFDSYQTLISGGILRRIMYWLSATATDKKMPVSRSQMEPVVSAAGKLCHNH